MKITSNQLKNITREELQREGMKITRRQLKRIIKEARAKNPRVVELTTDEREEPRQRFSRDPHKKDWAEAIQFFKDEHGVDLSDMDYKIQNTPVYTNGMPARLDPLLSAGAHTNLGWIQLATPKHQTRVQKHYQEKFPGSDPLIPQDQFFRSMMGHELAHEAWLRMPDEAKKRYATSEFTSGYLRALPADHKKLVSGEERFAEIAGHSFADDHVWRAQADLERATAAAGIDIRPEEYLSRRAQRLADIEAEKENQRERILWESKTASAPSHIYITGVPGAQ
jgi:hypothetical protein